MRAGGRAGPEQATEEGSDPAVGADGGEGTGGSNKSAKRARGLLAKQLKLIARRWRAGGPTLAARHTTKATNASSCRGKGRGRLPGEERRTASRVRAPVAEEVTDLPKNAYAFAAEARRGRVQV